MYLNIRVLGRGVFLAGRRVEDLHFRGRGLRGRGQHGIDDDVHGHQVHGCADCGREVRDDPPPVGHHQRIGHFEPVGSSLDADLRVRLR